MARESETYRDTLMVLREKANTLFPGKILLKRADVAKLLDKSTTTIHYRRAEYGFDANRETTLEKIARAISRG